MFVSVRSRLGAFNRHTVITIVTLQILVTSQYTHAVDCTRYKDRIEHYEQLRHGGGKAKQMSHWQITIDDLEEKLKQCSSASRIHVVSGATSKPSRKSAIKVTRNYVDTSETLVTNIQTSAQRPVDVPMVRKLKDCIKPNNLIDNEVSECMKGNLEPNWMR
jgi:hypothetical protein